MVADDKYQSRCDLVRIFADRLWVDVSVVGNICSIVSGWLGISVSMWVEGRVRQSYSALGWVLMSRLA
jgi:hypothetical protein